MLLACMNTHIKHKIMYSNGIFSLSFFAGNKIKIVALESLVFPLNNIANEKSYELL